LNEWSRFTTTEPLVDHPLAPRAEAHGDDRPHARLFPRRRSEALERNPLIAATCHCGKVRVEIPRRPGALTNCNCSICRRYGTLWAYYRASTVRIVHEAGATQSYVWGDRRLRFVRCRACGCITHWERASEPEQGRMGVNARNFDPDLLGPVRIRRLDGAQSWRFLPDDD
jgi:hypothetical protein